jgi:integrase
MSVVKRGNSRYWYIQFQLRGKTYIRSSRTTNKKAAEQMEVEMKAKIHGEEFLGHRQEISIRAAIEEFCASKQGTPHHRTLMYYCRPVLKGLPSQKHLSELTSHDLERFKRDRLHAKVSPQTVKHYINLIRGAWKLARKLGYRVGHLEFPTIKLPKSSLRYLSADEEARLLACLDPRRVEKHMPAFKDRPLEQQRNMQDAYDLVILLLDTGARYSEIANIEWSRVELAAHTIHLWRPKVQNEGILYMTDRVYAILKRRAQDNPEAAYVFQNRSGGPRGYIVGPIRKAIKKAGLEGCKIHTLRHTHASRLIQNGLSVYEVREVLGHTDIKTTMRYAHLESRQVTSKARDVINRLNGAPASSLITNPLPILIKEG